MIILNCKIEGGRIIKMKKNSKGFTLIELLAVIVVLAVIMVIATTQINRTIKKSRANSFYDSVLIIEKNAKMLCAQGTTLTAAELDNITEHDKNEYTISVTDDNDVTVTIVSGGKFDNVTLTDYYSLRSATDGKGEKAKESISAISGNSMTIKNPCAQ